MKWLERIKKNFNCGELKEIPCLKSRFCRCLFIALQLMLLFLVGCILIIWIGAEIDDHRSKKAMDTGYLYDTPHVCGIELPETFRNSTTATLDTYDFGASDFDPLVIQTFETEDDVNANSTITAHCGDCGFCSNPQDIQIYDDTKDSLFQSSIDCSKAGLFGGRRAVRKCLKEAVGFSEECNECWIENIMCDLKLCVFTCMWHGIFSEVNSGSGHEEQQPLNRCTQCDEKRCGPAFVKCAGANRRRSGILSEFERDLDQEVCEAVDAGWWKDERLQAYWDQQMDLEALSDDKDGDFGSIRHLRAL